MAQLYGTLSENQQDVLGKAIIVKLQSLIGGYGELSVLAEYIAVMLQSNRPADMIQTELEAFLQEQSKPFTRWLTKEIEKHTRAAAAAQAEGPADGGSEVLLNRVMKDARKSSGGVKVERTEKKRKHGDKPRTSSRRTAEAAPAAAPAAGVPVKERRSRSRRRRRKDAAAGQAPTENEARGKVVLTPNVSFLRDAYHKEDDPHGREATEPTDMSKWHFRAEPLSDQHGGPQQAASLAPGPEGYLPPQYGAPYGAPPGQHGIPPARAPPPGLAMRPMKTIAPKKWKVTRANTIVKETEALNSPEVRSLAEGEIVEQVSPSVTLQGGIVRICIRHPSSPQFPNPIGWVTLDATAAGGPKFLEPGPEPMSRGKPWAPPVGTRNAADMVAPGAAPPAWRPPAAAVAAPVAARAPVAPAGKAGPRGFQNLVWTPS